jgi:hypothetical protein
VNLKREEVMFMMKQGVESPSVVTDEIIKKTDENNHADRRLTIEELHQQCPEVSRTVLHEIVVAVLQVGSIGTTQPRPCPM